MNKAQLREFPGLQNPRILAGFKKLFKIIVLVSNLWVKILLETAPFDDIL
jgi:hypothetical protein